MQRGIPSNVIAFSRIVKIGGCSLADKPRMTASSLSLAMIYASRAALQRFEVSCATRNKDAMPIARSDLKITGMPQPFKLCIHAGVIAPRAHPVRELNIDASFFCNSRVTGTSSATDNIVVMAVMLYMHAEICNPHLVALSGRREMSILP